MQTAHKGSLIYFENSIKTNDLIRKIFEFASKCSSRLRIEPFGVKNRLMLNIHI